MNGIAKARIMFLCEFLCVTFIGIFSLSHYIYLNSDGAGYYISLNPSGISIQRFPLIVFPSIVYLYLKLKQFRSDQSDDMIRLKSQLESQLSFLYKLNHFDPNSDVRCTIHIPHKKNQYLQILNYIGSVRDGGGRLKSIDKGIVGMSLTQKMGFVESFKNEDQYHHCMLNVYNFTENELTRGLKPNRNSYFCYPITEDNEIFGVIYYDSKVHDTFLYTPSTGRCGPYGIDEADPVYKYHAKFYDEIKAILKEIKLLMG